MSKMGKMHNTPKLKSSIVCNVKGRDIENSPHKFGDLSSSDYCGGDSGDGGGHVESLSGQGGIGGIADEVEEQC